MKSFSRSDHASWLSTWILVAVLGVSDAWAGGPPITDLGDGRYRLGEILIDKPARTFMLAGVMIKDEPPLEYLAVKKDGQKAYESIFALNTTATEFNIACILIGLQAEHAVLPEFHFDPNPVQGDPGKLEIEWERDGSVKTLAPEQLFLLDGKPTPAATWIYTGSVELSAGDYLAERSGTLIGFIHDQDSIIEHREGIGLGNFGSVQIDKSVAPPVGTVMRLTVTNATPRSGP